MPDYYYREYSDTDGLTSEQDPQLSTILFTSAEYGVVSGTAPDGSEIFDSKTALDARVAKGEAERDAAINKMVERADDEIMG